MKKNILFVDDDRILRHLVKQKLASYADTFGTLLAADGTAAIQALKEKPVSIVVTDLQMPNMDGFALLAHLTAKYPDIPVIVLTGYSTPTSQKRVMENGAAAYIEKPFVVEDLADRILKTLQKENEGGTLQTVSMELFVQLIEMEQKTCTLRVFNKTTGKRGVLFIHKGELMDARIADSKGDAPAYEIMAWDRVTISIQEGCAVTDKRVKGTLQAILFDAVRSKDKAGAEPEEPEAVPVASMPPESEDDT